MKNKKPISLNEIGKELPFTVPDDYFNNFAAQLEQRIGMTEKPVVRFVKPWMYMAAMFVGIFVVTQIFYTLFKAGTILSEENYESYVLSQVDEPSLVDYYVDESVK